MNRINILYPCFMCDRSDTDLELSGRGAPKDKRWVLTCRNCGATWNSPEMYYAQKAAAKKLAEWNAKYAPADENGGAA